MKENSLIYSRIQAMNQILKCMRTSRNIYQTANQITRGAKIDWDSWPVKRTEEVLSYFLSKSLCEVVADIKGQYKAFVKSFRDAENKIQNTLNTVIDRTPGLKIFMAIHSIFDVKENSDYDWLEMFMIRKLAPTNKEVYELFHPDLAPVEALEKLKIFEPEQILFNVDLIRIEYGMWKRDSDNRIKDPINIIDTTFDGIEVVKRADIAKELAKFTDMASYPVPASLPSDWIEDDLPF